MSDEKTRLETISVYDMGRAGTAIVEQQLVAALDRVKELEGQLVKGLQFERERYDGLRASESERRNLSEQQVRDAFDAAEARAQKAEQALTEQYAQGATDADARWRLQEQTLTARAEKAEQENKALRGIYELVRDHMGHHMTDRDREDALVAIDDVMGNDEPADGVLEMLKRTQAAEARAEKAEQERENLKLINTDLCARVDEQNMQLGKLQSEKSIEQREFAAVRQERDEARLRIDALETETSQYAMRTLKSVVTMQTAHKHMLRRDDEAATAEVRAANAEARALRAEADVVALNRWPTVRAFAEAMCRKLDQHRLQKGGREGWENDDPYDLLRRVRDEAVELEGELVARVRNDERLLGEAADVANMAMMVADAACALGVATEHPGSALLEAVEAAHAVCCAVVKWNNQNGSIMDAAELAAPALEALQPYVRGGK